jgi:hypothetical protein
LEIEQKWSKTAETDTLTANESTKWTLQTPSCWITCGTETNETLTENPGANPTIASYNASFLKIYNATISMARF